MDSDNTLGYGKPPTGTQFQPGQSGNPGGRPKRGISYWTKEYGEATSLEFTVKMTDSNGGVTTSTSKIETDGEVTINQMIAIRGLQKALKGDFAFYKEVLNRTEGRVPQPIKLGGDSDNPLSVLLMVPDSGRLEPLASNIPPATEPNE